MATYYASVANFSLTSSWYVSSSSQGISASTPSTDSSDKTFDFTGIPAGSVINSATLTATLGSPSTGAALRTVDGGSFSGSKGVSITPGGYNTFRFRFKANGAANLPVGDRSSTLSFSDVTITVDYTPPGESGSGGNPTPPAIPANIGTLSAYPKTLTAGQTLYVDIGPSDSDLTRYVRLYRTDTGEHLFTMLANHNNTAASPNFSIPLEWCGLAPNDTQFQITVQLYAEKTGPSWGGVEYQTINVLVPDSAKPTIGTFSATRVANGVNAAITNYVQNYSKVSLAIGDVNGALDSSVVSYEISGGGLIATSSSATLGPISQSGSITFTAKVVDSRGRVGTKTVAINVEPYSAVSVNNLQAYRSDANKNPADEGAFATLIGKLVFSSIGGQNAGTIKGRVYEKGTAVSGWTTMSNNTLVLFGGSLSVEKAYTAEISINDLITSYVYSIDIPTATVIMGISPNGDGVSFGGYPEAGKLKSAWPIVAPNFYPVGAIYMSYASTSPATFFGGTWSALPTGKVLRTGTGGATGGSDTHAHTTPSVALTVEQLASHTHKTKFSTSYTFTNVSGGAVALGYGSTEASETTVATGSGATHGHGNTGSASNVPAYYEIYAWRRTA